jgi:hypothetical protein
MVAGTFLRKWSSWLTICEDFFFFFLLRYFTLCGFLLLFCAFLGLFYGFLIADYTDCR